MNESSYKHNYEYLSINEAKAIINGTFVQGSTSIGGELATKSDIDSLLDAAGKHMTSIVAGDGSEYVCYFEWASNRVEPTSVSIQDITMTVGGKKQLSYTVIPSNSNIDSVKYTITSGSDIAHIDGSYVVADKAGSAVYSIIINNSITSSANITVSNKPEEFPDDFSHRWITVSPTTSSIPYTGGSINVTGSYGLTGTYGTKKTIGTIQDTITISENTSNKVKTGSKIYYYNNNSSETPTAKISWTQQAYVETFKYEYDIKVGTSSSDISNNTVSLIWENTSSGQDAKKTIYVKAVQKKINSLGVVVQQESVPFVFNNKPSGFTITSQQNMFYVYPNSANTSVSNNFTGVVSIYIENHVEKSCNIQLVQLRSGANLRSGDAVMFTYNWDSGRDLDQATFVNLNVKDSNGWAGFGSTIPNAYKNILYFAGDNTGIGKEYAFIDFKAISKYLDENGQNESSVSGKTILQSLTDNGITCVTCDLYNVWYGTKQSENIQLDYQMYKKQSESASVTAENLKFVLNGYSEIDSNKTFDALCYANGKRNYAAGARKTYTQTGKLTYYLNSGFVVFETNKDNVSKWQKGVIYTVTEEQMNVNPITIQYINDSLQLSATLQSLYIPDKSTATVKISLTDQKNNDTGYSTNYYLASNNLPTKLQYSVSKDTISKKFGSGTFGFKTKVSVTSLYDDDKFIQYSVNDVYSDSISITI